MLLTALAVTACASEPELQFADWILDVPEGTTVHEYPAVPIEDRDPGAVRMVEDLVIGGDPSDANALLYQPIAVWASPSGDILVAEMGNKRVQMFDADGRFVRTIGKEGQGPGEFQFPFFMIGDSNRFGVYDLRNRRISVFSAAGDYEFDQPASLSLYTNIIAPLADGSFVAITSNREPNRDFELGVKHFSFAGEELATLAQGPGPPLSVAMETDDPVARAQRSLDRLAYPRPLHAAGEGLVFISPAGEYQVLAMTPDGGITWALRTAWPRPPYPERLKRSRLQALFGDEPDIPASALTWPEDRDALQSMSTDAQGRLYVFPNFEEDGEEPPEFHPVDVYSAAGERIATGLLDDRWSFARGDYVYGFRSDDSLDQTTVVRYRLLVNGQ